MIVAFSWVKLKKTFLFYFVFPQVFVGKYGHIKNIDIRFEFLTLVNKNM